MHVWLGIAIILAVTGDPATVKHSDTWPNSAKSLGKDDQARADFVIDEMMATLSEIHSGDVEILQTVQPQADSYAHKNRLLFDYEKQLERFDQLSGHLAQRIRADDETILHLPKNIFTRLGEVRKSPGYISVNERKDEADVVGTIPIDVRIAGIGNLAHLRNHWTWQKFDEHRNTEGSFYTGTLSYIDESDPVFTDLLWIGTISRGRPTKILLRLDRSRDYVPVLYAMFVRDKNERFDLISTNTAEWASLKKTWVPVQWTLTLKSPSIFHELQFQWHSVNETIEPKRFTIDDLDAPIGTPVVNARIKDRVVVVREIGR